MFGTRNSEVQLHNCKLLNLTSNRTKHSFQMTFDMTFYLPKISHAKLLKLLNLKQFNTTFMLSI